MREIRYGLEDHLDVSKYTDPDIPPERMRSIRQYEY